MLMSKLFNKTILLFIAALVLPVNHTWAQVLPLLNSFRGGTYQRTVDVSWPVLFENCVFVTDSVAITHSYGAVFRNCTFESRSGVFYVADSGDGIILADCEFRGCSELRFSRHPGVSDRNYITGIKVNGDECSVLDDQESIIEIDGLELGDAVTAGKGGPMLMFMSADSNTLRAGETAILRLRGLDEDMFVGWRSSDSLADMVVDEPFVCRVTAPERITDNGTIVVSAYTEYGLESACVLKLEPETEIIKQEKKSRKRRK